MAEDRRGQGTSHGPLEQARGDPRVDSVTPLAGMPGGGVARCALGVTEDHEGVGKEHAAWQGGYNKPAVGRSGVCSGQVVTGLPGAGAYGGRMGGMPAVRGSGDVGARRRLHSDGENTSIRRLTYELRHT